MYSTTLRNVSVSLLRKSVGRNKHEFTMASRNCAFTKTRNFTTVMRTMHHCSKPSSRVTFTNRALSSNPPPMNKKSPLPFMLMSLTGCAGVAVIAKLFSDYRMEQIEEEKKKAREANKSQISTRGKALIGGPFTLVDTDGNKVTNKDFLGKWLLIYFGFTFCPDICPEELEKIGDMVDLLDKTPEAPKVKPIFISVDPKRDTPDLIKTYLQDFHPRFIGLTGTSEQIKRATKSYRVYYSEGPDKSGGLNEYIVDHSIVTFLVDPAGNFSQNFGPKITAEEAADKIAEKMNAFYSS